MLLAVLTDTNVSKQFYIKMFLKKFILLMNKEVTLNVYYYYNYYVLID